MIIGGAGTSRRVGCRSASTAKARAAAAFIGRDRLSRIVHGTRWSPFGIRAIWGSSTRWGGPSRFVRESACCTLTIPPLLARIRAEESLLRTQFGEHDAYCRRTSRLIAGLY